MSETASEVVRVGSLCFIFFVVTGQFAFGGPLSFLRKGIAAVKQYREQRKQQGETAGIYKCLWKGIGLAVFGMLGTGTAVLLLLLLLATGPYAIIFVIAYLAYAAPSLLLWGVVLSWLHLRGRRAPECRERSKKRTVMAILYLVLGALGVWAAFYMNSISGRPLDL